MSEASATSTQADGAEAASLPWLQLSAWSVLYFIARNIAALVGNFWTLVPVVYVGVQSGAAIVVGIVSVLLAGIVAFAFLQYRFFRYRLTGKQVEVRQGVLSRRATSLEFGRVQNVNIELPFYYRPLRLVTLKIDSAGSSGDEVDLSALTGAAAASIRAQIVAGRQSDVVGDGDTTNEGDGTGDLLITRSNVDLIIHGLTNNRAWIVAGGALALLGQAGDRLDNLIANQVAALGDQATAALAEQSLVIVALVVVGLVLLVVAFMSLLSVLGSILSYYDFRLYGSSDRLTVQRGLLVRRETNLRKSRVQVVVSDESWLDRAFARRNLVYEQLRQASGDGAGSGRDESRAVVPSVNASQLLSLSREIGPLPNTEALTYQGVNVRQFLKSLLKLAALNAAIVLLALALGAAAGWLVAGSVLLWLLVAPLCWLAWKRWGLALTSDYLVVRRGIIGVSYYTVPVHKLQKVRLSRSWLMGRNDLLHVTFTVASRALTVPMFAGESARLCADLMLARVESERRSWM